MVDVIVTILLLVGVFFFFAGAVGIIRFPDFYSRLHPAGKLDTMGQLACMAAMALYTLQGMTLNDVLTALKILLIVVFVFITSPTATHAIVDAGVRAGLTPWTRPPKEESR